MSDLWGALGFKQWVLDPPKFKGYEMPTPFIYKFCDICCKN